MHYLSVLSMFTFHVSAEIFWHFSAVASPQPTLTITTLRNGDQREGREKKKKSAWKSEEEGVRGEKSRDLERVQLSARDRSVSGSWQPRPDEETGWRHSKPGRESSTDGKERGTHLIKQWHLGNALACSLSF